MTLTSQVFISVPYRKMVGKRLHKICAECHIVRSERGEHMNRNWLLARMQLLEIGATELSRRLGDYDVQVSRQTIENWCKMPDERLPVHINHPELVQALVEALEYPKITDLLYELGYKVEPGPILSHHYKQLLLKIDELDPADREPVMQLLLQILAKWRDVNKIMHRPPSDD